MSKKRILFLSTDGFEDVELVAVRDILIRSGFEVDLAFSSENEYVNSTYNLKIKVELTLKKVLNFLDDYQALFIPGGIGAEKLDKDPLVYQIIEHFKNKDKYMGAICIAPFILAKAKVLEGKNAICYPDKKIQSILIKEGAKLVSTNCKTNEDCSVVIDGKVITGLNMETSFKFAYQFAKLLEA